MNVGIYGSRPSMMMDNAEEIAAKLVNEIISNGHHVNVGAALGFNMEVLKALKTKGGCYTIFLRGPFSRVTRRWRQKNNIDLLFFSLKLAKNIVVPRVARKAKESKEEINRLFVSMSDIVVLCSDSGLDDDLLQIYNLSTDKVTYIIDSIDDLEGLEWDLTKQ